MNQNDVVIEVEKKLTFYKDYLYKKQRSKAESKPKTKAADFNNKYSKHK